MTGSLVGGVLTLLFIEFYWVQMSSYFLAMHSYQRVFMNRIKLLFETFRSGTIWGKQHIRTSVKYLNRPKWEENTNCHSIVVSRYCFKSWSNFKPNYEHRWSFSNENYGLITAFGPSTDNKTGMKVTWLAKRKTSEISRMQSDPYQQIEFRLEVLFQFKVISVDEIGIHFIYYGGVVLNFSWNWN